MIATPLDCGHGPTPHSVRPPLVDHTTGCATAPNGRTLCFACADAEQRAELLTESRVFAYLSSDRRRVMTWTGGELGRVTSYKQDNGRWSSFGIVHRCYVRVTDVHGQHWSGTGPVENGDYVRLRRAQ